VAVTSATRSVILPDVPTVAESGFPGFSDHKWFSFLAPAGTPKFIVNKLNAEITRIFSLPDVMEKIAALDIEFIGGSPEDATAYMQSKSSKWDKLLQQAGIKPE
jgi:tripartite-type tricarboxylate transporter receptor subunit TctC